MSFEDMLVASHRPGQNVDKGLVHLVGEALDARFFLLEATSGGNRIFATTLSELIATTSTDGDFAVLPASAGAESGVYRKSTGTWTKQFELLDLAAKGVVPLTLTNSDGDALEAVSGTPLPSSHAGFVFTLTVPATNDTEGVTISLNGVAAIPVLSSTGSALPADYLPPGAVIILTSRGDALQLISHDDAAAASRAAAAASATEAAGSATTASTASGVAITAQQAAEAAQQAAETARDEAQGVSLGNTSGVPNSSSVPGASATAALNGLYANHKGSSRPAGALAGTQWIDDTGTPWLLKQFDGTDDLTLARINATDNTIEWVQSAEQTLASQATVDLGSKTGRAIRITGTTAIASFGVADAGVERVLRFTNVLTLTHHGTSLILLGGADIITAAGDTAVVRSEGSGNWRMTSYQRASGEALVQPPAGTNYDDDIAVLAMGLADALNVAQFLGDTGNRFADNFDVLTYVDDAGATNLNTSEAGVLQPTGGVSANLLGNHTAATQDGNTISVSSQSSASLAGWMAADGTIGGSGGENSWASQTGVAAWWQVQFGSPKTITSYRMQVHATFLTNMPSAWRLLGSNTGSFAGEETVLDTVSGQSWSDADFVSFDCDTSGSFTYYRIDITANGGASNIVIGEIEMFESGAPDDMIVETAGLTSSAQPDALKAWLVIQEVDSITPNIDLTVRVSRDGGSTFAAATLAQSYALPGGKKLVETGAVDVSGQPPGTTPVMEISTANAKMVKVHSHALYWS